MTLDISGFLICATIIFFAGRKLSYYGDLLADLSGMGKAWIGLVLMSAVTSLPELMVGISSVTIVQSADLAVGDILGSCAFNLGILSLMDLFTPRSRPLFSSVSKSHILAGTFGIILVALAGLGLFFDEDIILAPSIGLTSFTFAFIYFISIQTIYRYQKIYPVVAVEKSTQYTDLSLNKVIRRYAYFAVMIIMAALALPYFAGHLADRTGMEESFVGTLLLAGSTSLPEIAISLAAVRSGSGDMAVGNLLGSNIFNIFILFLDDLLYTDGHLLKNASDANLVSVFFVILMASTAIIGLMFPGREKKTFMSWDTLGIFSMYILNLILLYKIS